MANRTKIIVIRKKELLLSVALILLITVLLLTFLCFMHKSPAPTEEASPTMAYVPGVYTATITMGDTPMNVEVVVDENNINAISIKNLDEAMETMYPLVAPAMENLSAQILSSLPRIQPVYLHGTASGDPLRSG